MLDFSSPSKRCFKKYLLIHSWYLSSKKTRFPLNLFSALLPLFLVTRWCERFQGHQCKKPVVIVSYSLAGRKSNVRRVLHYASFIPMRLKCPNKCKFHTTQSIVKSILRMRETDFWDENLTRCSKLRFKPRFKSAHSPNTKFHNLP